MFGIGAMELVVILVLALIIFGPGKLPEVGKAIGRGVREFKKATSEVMDDDTPDTDRQQTEGASSHAAVQTPTEQPSVEPGQRQGG